jgi:hypothetical protein
MEMAGWKVMATKSRKATGTITIYGFKGMNNLPKESAVLVDRQNRCTPRIVLNAVVGDSGVIYPRDGYERAIRGGIHSVWSKSAMFGVGVDDSVLYRIDGVALTPLAVVPGPRSRLQYDEVGNLVYMSNGYWRASYDLLSGQMRPWGVPVPASPRVSIGPGYFPPGTYTLCFTQTDGDQMSGNGPLVQVSWEGEEKGIRLLNFPEGGECWITHPNGKALYRAIVDGGVIQGHHPQAEPLLPLSVTPPPNFEDFAFAFGRMWGAKNNRVHYSMPGYPDWFRQGDYRLFLQPIVMVAPVNNGIFVHSRASSWYLQGTDPGKMELSRVGDGAIPGTLTYAHMPASLAGGAATSANFATMSQMPSPIWMSQAGFVVGTHSGHLTSLTDHRLRLRPRFEGASLFRVKSGVPQIVTTLYGPPTTEIEDGDELSPIFTNNKLD